MKLITRSRWISLFLIWVVVTLNFFLFRILPGDPVRFLFNDPRMTEEIRQRLYASFGLDKPLPVQYGLYLLNSARGELGKSFVHLEPVAKIVGEKLVNTIILVGPATFLAIILGSLLGVVMAYRRGTTTDTGILGMVLLFWATPTFWVGLLIIVAFLGVLPTSGMFAPGASYLPFSQKIGSLLTHLILPLITLSFALTGQYAMIMRNTLIDILSEDFSTTAKSRGFRDHYILRRHAVPNAMLPMTTIIAINIGLIMGGAVQTETVFSWPGIGRLMYDSILTRDYPVLQGSFLVMAVCMIMANFVADILYGFFDPRVRYY